MEDRSRSRMPKKQVLRGTSKNAKDRSNTATLLAAQGMALNGRISRCDSEKDSGYSEAGSDSVQTDGDDQRSSVSGNPQTVHRSSITSGGRSTASLSTASACTALPAYEEITPIYVIKNLVVNSVQSGTDQLLQSPLAWGGGWHALPGTNTTPTQILLIQQPGKPTSSPVQSCAQSSKLFQPQNQSKMGGGERSNKNRSVVVDSYLPILKSYPRIAPHPRKEVPSEQPRVKEVGSEGQSQSKRVCTEKREAVSTTSQLLLHRHQKGGKPPSHPLYSPSPQPAAQPSLGSHTSSSSCPSSFSSSSSRQDWSHYHSARPSSSSVRSNSTGSPSISSSQAPSPSFSTGSASPVGSHFHSTPEAWQGGNSTFSDSGSSQSDRSSVRRHQFLNTKELLSQSGMLAVTLRTKELLRQNGATERDIAQLRQHTQLLCLAAQAQASQQGSSESSKPLDKLLQTMAECGSYPSLDWRHVSHHYRHLAEKGDEAEKEKDSNGRGDRFRDNSLPLSIVGIQDDRTKPPSPLFAPSPDHQENTCFSHALSISPPAPSAWPLPLQGEGVQGND